MDERCSVVRLSDRKVLTHIRGLLPTARVHKQRQARVQKREQRVKRRNAGGTASTHHAACSRPLHKRPCRLAARANERFYNSMQSPPEGPFGLSLFSFLRLCSLSTRFHRRVSLSLLSLQPLALLRASRVSLPCERRPVVAVHVRARTALSFFSFPSSPKRTRRTRIYIPAKKSGLFASLMFDAHPDEEVPRGFEIASCLSTSSKRNGVEADTCL